MKLEDEFLKNVSTLNASDFKVVMSDYGDAVWNYAFFLSKKKELADDIAQDTFEKAYRHLNDFRGQCSLKTWLLTITRNTWFSYRKLAFMRKVTLVDYLVPRGTVSSAEDQFLMQHFNDQVWNAVLQLPRKYREVLLLHAHHNQTIEEIAITLSISVDAVKSRLRRAKKQAYDNLEKEGELSGNTGY
jgi:RNA polymerase sigma-70 factor (ECF subfamily)